jgi:hypothetical protein
MRLFHLTWIAALLGAVALWSHSRIKADPPADPDAYRVPCCRPRSTGDAAKPDQPADSQRIEELLRKVDQLEETVRVMQQTVQRLEGVAQQRETELAQKKKELQFLLADLKNGKPAAEAHLRAWMNDNVPAGKATLEEVRQLFGDNYVNLDRPDRDDVLTMQYSVDDVGGKKLILDFTEPKPHDPQADLFVRYFPGLAEVYKKDARLHGISFGQSICGFCPHILVDDGNWRLEGKMLAGAIGAGRESDDTLVLPRAQARNGKVKLRLANWAPEVEQIDQVQLGVVVGQPGEQLDVDRNGQPHLWQQSQNLVVESPRTTGDRDNWHLELQHVNESRVLVLELRNTESFEKTMRAAIRKGGEQLPDAELTLHFDGNSTTINPVGTKFLRRVLIPLPAGTSHVDLACPAGMWWVRRAWLGQGHPASIVHWLSPTEATGPEDALSLLHACDRARLQLTEREETQLTFTLPSTIKSAQHLFYVLRMHGYYEFDREAIERERETDDPFQLKFG